VARYPVASHHATRRGQERSSTHSDVTEPTWHDRAFAELSLDELYAIMVLRDRVFVIEQQCIYQDADGKDPACRHVFATRGDAILAYLRVIPPGVAYDEASIGRVVVAPEARGTGIGHDLMKRGLATAGDGAIRIGAQAYLQAFYEAHGFRAASAIYIEDGIPHLQMLRARRSP